MPEEASVNNPSDSTKYTKEDNSIDKTKSPKTSKIVIYALLIVILVVFLGILAYINLFAGKNKEKETQATPSASKAVKQEEVEETKETKDTEVTKPEAYCTDGTVYENTKQGYKVCLIKGWYTSEFDPLAKGVGFDPNPIPEASEYGGIIVVNVSDKAAAQVTITVNENLEGETSSAVTVNGVAGTQISGNIPADNFYYPGYKEVVSIFSKFSRTYEVTMISAPDKLTANQGLYNDFLAGWRFLGMAGSPP